MKLKILQVVEPGCDGVFTHVDGLVRFLVQEGHCVSLAYSSVRSRQKLFDLVEFVRARGGKTLDLQVRNTPSLRDIGNIAKLKNLIAHGDFDAVHAHSSKAGALVRIAAKFCSAKVFYTPHAYYGMGQRGGIQTKLFNAIESFLKSNAHTVNISEEERRFANTKLGVLPSQQSLIPNPVDCDTFKPLPSDDRINVRNELGFPKDCFILGTVGRFSYQKDPETLYESFIEVARDTKDVCLAHLGQGELQGDMEQLISRAGLRSRYVQIEYSSLPEKFYQALDGFILSSRYEGLSFSVLEAMATNLPILLSDAPGNQTFGKLGLDAIGYAKPQDVAGFAKLIRAWRDVEIARVDSNTVPNHRQIALQQFSFEACFGGVLNCYQAAMPSTRFKCPDTSLKQRVLTKT